MVPLTNRVKVRVYVYCLTIEIKDFAFEVNAILGLESTLLGGRVARICDTITRVHKMKKRAHRSEPDRYLISSNTDRD